MNGAAGSNGLRFEVVPMLDASAPASEWSSTGLLSSWLRVLALTFLALASIAPGMANASPPREPAKPLASTDTIKTQYHHTSWTAKDGAPTGIWSITQTLDGMLWLGSHSGLYRFDGVHFERVDTRPPGNTGSLSVTELYLSKAGDVWVSYAINGTDRIVHGDIRTIEHYSDISGLKELAGDDRGNIFAVTTSAKILYFNGSTWRDADSNLLPPGQEVGFDDDADGRLWYSTTDGLYVREPGSRTFKRTAYKVHGETELLPTPPGRVLVIDSDGYHALDYTTSRHDVNAYQSSFTVQSNDHSLWTVDCGSGICRVGGDQVGSFTPLTLFPTDRFSSGDGLSSDTAMTIYPDREGSIWVGTKSGLDQFRRTGVAAFNAKTFADAAFAPAKSGDLYVATDSDLSAGERLLKLGSRLSVLSNMQNGARSAYEADDGAYFGLTGHLWRVSDDIAHEIQPAPPGGETHGILAITKDLEGALWLSLNHDGVFRQSAQGWENVSARLNLPKSTASVMVTSSDGAVWIGYDGGRIARIAGNQVRWYGSQQGLQSGPVTAILTDPAVLVAGDRGLYALHGDRFSRIRATNSNITGISGLATDLSGNLWINCYDGVYEIDKGNLQAALSSASPAIDARHFDSEDGIAGGVNAMHAGITAVRGSDGRLWFATTEGIASIDPAAVPRNKVVPTAEILGIEVDGKEASALDSVNVPPNPKSIVYRYTAASLLVPSRVRFKVKLDGVDADWVNVGGRRSVEYKDLRPGSYAFHVMAANDNGVWSSRDAHSALEVPAAFYQKWWFRLLCVAAIGLILVLMSLAFARLAVRRAKARIRDRLTEREQIARDLHDTLLQDIDAIVLNLEALHRRSGPVDPGDLRAVTEASRVALAEARQRVTGLRTGPGNPFYLFETLKAYCDVLATRFPARFDVKMLGKPRKLQPIAASEVISIVHEALLNASRHANASNIATTLRFHRTGIRVVIADDGVGISRELLRHGKPDHWGQIGMKERAARLRATLTLKSKEGQGTTVTLAVSGRIVFDRKHSRRVFRVGRSIT